MDGNTERMCALVLSDANDPTRLTWKEVQASWGSWTNFVISYGLKPYNPEDLQEALGISRSLKQARNEEEEDQ